MPAQLADAPLLVTAHLDDASFAILDGLRRRHFPAEINIVPAHLSLFHKLPGDQLDSVRQTLTDVCSLESGFDLDGRRPSCWGGVSPYGMRRTP